MTPDKARIEALEYMNGKLLETIDQLTKLGNHFEIELKTVRGMLGAEPGEQLDGEAADIGKWKERAEAAEADNANMTNHLRAVADILCVQNKESIEDAARRWVTCLDDLAKILGAFPRESAREAAHRVAKEVDIRSAILRDVSEILGAHDRESVANAARRCCVDRDTARHHLKSERGILSQIDQVVGRHSNETIFDAVSRIKRDYDMSEATKVDSRKYEIASAELAQSRKDESTTLARALVAEDRARIAEAALKRVSKGVDVRGEITLSAPPTNLRW